VTWKPEETATAKQRPVNTVPQHSKIWSWVLWDSEPRITVLARASSNLAVSQIWLGGRKWVVSQLPSSKDVSMEANESSLLGAVTKQRLAKTSKTLCVLELQWSLVCKSLRLIVACSYGL
jgi:hypothetical protein